MELFIMIRSNYIGESFQDYAWIKEFGADIPSRAQKSWIVINILGAFWKDLVLHGWKFSALFKNSEFWGWLSLKSQPWNTELGRF